MTPRLKPLDRQVIVVTGASSGIGLATARLAARRGARVVVVARSADALARLTGEINGSGGTALAVAADVADEAQVRHVARVAVDTFGGFDTWVNNAAVSAYGRCLDVSLADMCRIMDTNFWGVVYGSRIACEQLAATGGALVNVGSVLSDRGAPLQGIYSASKQAIKGWTDALRTELMHDGAPVSVTLVKPAAIGTPYAEHAKNYLDDQPSHIPPVYSPRSVARAILHAAEHPVREITVGSTSRLLTLANGLVPRLTDQFMARLLIPGMHSGGEPHGRPALFEPTEDLRERGSYPGIVRPSLTTALATRPKLQRTLGLGLAGAAMALLLAARRK